MTGTLYLVSIPIGNNLDITYRAIEVLQNCNFILIESTEGNKFLNKNKITTQTEIFNEHNQLKNSSLIIEDLKKGKNISLISDCGTPLFSDPGFKLVQLAIQNKIKVVPIPGASSLMAALIVSGFDISKFLFYGWLSQKKEIRQKELISIKTNPYTLVIMETPYRLKSLMEDVVKYFGTMRKVCLAYNLTMQDELIMHSNTGELLEKINREKIKGEFVLIFEGFKRT
ncbi:MAG: 16S rRNA (cytidine(1402)-2'-O)-methyltransferase [Bacteroidetes bacterium]|nr:16S rRNA (cytidine(1402)-2'-O)-methyltransferase [Bacteroidota bacterium]